jgi:peptidoglycan/xylan/chitin deacetylase (PgdA/CDA1 family)
MKDFYGKKKAITFSYDDGVTQDVRLIELFNKYGLKCTFNLNSGVLGKPGMLLREGVNVTHNKIAPELVRSVYEGHEVATHSVNHPYLTRLTDEEVVREIEDDRIRLSELVGYDVVGHAYPMGDCDERVARLLEHRTGVKYARTVVSTHNFDIQTDLHLFNPTVYHHREMDKMFELGRKFLELQTQEPQIYYVWGHAYEFDIYQNWNRFEEFLEMMSGREDIYYCTNKEALLMK